MLIDSDNNNVKLCICLYIKELRWNGVDLTELVFYEIPELIYIINILRMHFKVNINILMVKSRAHLTRL